MEWRTSTRESILVHLVDKLVYYGYIREIFVGEVAFVFWVSGSCVRQAANIRYVVNQVHPEPIAPTVDPEACEVLRSGAHHQILPVEVGLLRNQQMEV